MVFKVKILFLKSKIFFLCHKFGNRFLRSKFLSFHVKKLSKFCFFQVFLLLNCSVNRSKTNRPMDFNELELLGCAYVWLGIDRVFFRTLDDTQVAASRSGSYLTQQLDFIIVMKMYVVPVQHDNVNSLNPLDEAVSYHRRWNCLIFRFFWSNVWVYKGTNKGSATSLTSINVFSNYAYCVQISINYSYFY